MRQRYDQMLFDCPIGHLYGLCLLGTSLRVYCGDNDTGKITFATICPLLTLRRAYPSDSGIAYFANVGFKDDTANLYLLKERARLDNPVHLLCMRCRGRP